MLKCRRLAAWSAQIWVSWRKRNLFDLEWLAEERRKGEDLERERLRHVAEHMKLTSGYQEAMQSTRGLRPTSYHSIGLYVYNVHNMPAASDLSAYTIRIPFDTWRPTRRVLTSLLTIHHAAHSKGKAMLLSVILLIVSSWLYKIIIWV